MKAVIALSTALLLSLTLACSDLADQDIEGSNNANVQNQVDPNNQGMCYVDFPCRANETMHCAGAATYRKTETLGCENFCGGSPCSGAACVDKGPMLQCPLGQVCIRDWRYGHHCAPPDSGPDWMIQQQVSEGLVPALSSK